MILAEAATFSLKGRKGRGLRVGGGVEGLRGRESGGGSGSGEGLLLELRQTTKPPNGNQWDLVSRSRHIRMVRASRLVSDHAANVHM